MARSLLTTLQWAPPTREIKDTEKTILVLMRHGFLNAFVFAWYGYFVRWFSSA
jgi:hypothetical protein